MVPVTGFAGRTVAVFGLGLSGVSAARALAAGGARVLAFDDGAAGLARAQAAGIATTDLRAADWSAIDALVLSPGVPLTHPAPHWTVALARAAGVEIIGDTELFERERRRRAPGTRLVAITGTNGKSTTTALIGHILKAVGLKVALGGNIGTPILDLDDVGGDTVYVVEYSSYQIDLTPSLKPDVGLLLNLSPDHLDRHGSMEHYVNVKAGLVERAAKAGTAIIGVDDADSRAVAARLEADGGRVMRIAAAEPLHDGLFAKGETLMLAEKGAARMLADLAGIATLRGAHNRQNAAAAFAAARALGVADADIAAALAGFPGLAHRMEEVARVGPVLFVNDSKATNADAAARALASFEHIHWIAGGVAKAGGIAPLRPYFGRIAHAYLIGEAAEDFAKTLHGNVPFTISGDLGSAVAAAARDALADSSGEAVVLLSPACASFDQFANFEARGEAFREAAGRVAAERSAAQATGSGPQAG